MIWEEPHPRHLPSVEEQALVTAEIHSLAGQISELTEQIRQLSQARDKLQQDLRNRQAFLAPFRRLPQDVLYIIIGYYAEGDPANSNLARKLSTVCTSMRDAVNGMKSLWNNIKLESKEGFRYLDEVGSG